MTPRLRWQAAAQPLVLAGTLLVSSGVEALAGRPPMSPCSPDGTCIPNRPTWGVYQTHWRPYPGDVVRKEPTLAKEETAEKEREKRDQEMRGPLLPAPKEETETGPKKPEPGAEGVEEAPAEVAPAVEAPAMEAPAGEAPADAAPAPQEPAEADPFGAQPPALPQRLAERTAGAPNVASEPLTQDQRNRGADSATIAPRPTPRPGVKQAAVIGEDQPPVLPASLIEFARSGGKSRVVPAAARLALPPSVQPSAKAPEAGVRSDADVNPASAEAPLGIQLVNPAEARIAEPGAEEVQQAIYFEASDQSAQLAPLPSVEE
jgi:hypothetical protein